jgi:hypothetical protein
MAVAPVFTSSGSLVECRFLDVLTNRSLFRVSDALLTGLRRCEDGGPLLNLAPAASEPTLPTTLQNHQSWSVARLRWDRY